MRADQMVGSASWRGTTSRANRQNLCAEVGPVFACHPQPASFRNGVETCDVVHTRKSFPLDCGTGERAISTRPRRNGPIKSEYAATASNRAQAGGEGACGLRRLVPLIGQIPHS